MSGTLSEEINFAWDRAVCGKILAVTLIMITKMRSSKSVIRKWPSRWWDGCSHPLKTTAMKTADAAGDALD